MKRSTSAMRTFIVAHLPDRVYRGALGSKILRNPMAPGVLAWGLLAAAHVLTNGIAHPATVTMAGTGMLFIVLFLACRSILVPLPFIPKRDVLLFLGLSFGIFALEILYAGGLPLLGSAKYTEFGLPILHHVVFSVWVLPLIAPRYNAFYLAVALVVGAAMFSRQLMILALIGYLMRASLRNVVIPLVIAVGLVALGSMRNAALGVEETVSQGGEFVSGPFGHLLFWVYLYVLGPFMVTFGADSGVLGAVAIENYWNTVPDWAILTRLGMPLNLALAAFYPLVALTVVVLTRLRNFETRVFGACIHVLAFVTFFSNTLVSTPVVGTFLVIAFLRRAQQIGQPTPGEKIYADAGS